MPYKNKADAIAHGKKYYKENKKNWKNADGTWKQSYADNLEKRRKVARESYYKHREKRRKYYKKKGEKLRESRKGPCEVCGILCHRYWDHNHETDMFRGWLCAGCNLAIGHAKESPEILRKLAIYLEERGGRMILKSAEWTYSRHTRSGK